MKKRLLVTFIVFFLCISAGFSALSFLDDVANESEIEKNIKNLRKIYQYASDNYLYEIDHKKVYEACAVAMLDAFGDKWTQYIVSDIAQNYGESITGTFSGIGVYLSKTAPANQNPEDEKTLYLLIDSCFKDGPAYKAGIMSSELITKIDGQDVIHLTATECSKMLRGLEGTTVTVTVKRGDEFKDIEIQRAVVSTPSVESEKIGRGTLYIGINSFASNTITQVQKAINDADFSIKSIIIDLRDNGGGDVSSCLQIADLFLEGRKTMISTYSKVKNRNKTYTSTNGTIVPVKVSMVILVNKGSASASEILSAALHDNERAVLIGEKTYGKGVMQVSSPFGDGYINVTTAEYHTPKGAKVHEVGIEPDIPVEQYKFSTEEAQEILKLKGDARKAAIREKDTVLQYAINYLNQN